MTKLGLLSLIFITFCILIISVVSFTKLEILYKTTDCLRENDVLIHKFAFDIQETLQIPFFLVRPGKHTFHAKTRRISPKNPVIYIPFIDGNTIRVYFNGTLIGISGNPFSTNSLRWNRPELFLIPREMIKDENDISIEVNTENTIGIFEPVFVGEYSHIKHKYRVLFCLNQLLSFFNIMVFIIVGLLFLTIPILTKEAYHRILIGLALVLYSIYNIDYSYIPFLPLPYALYKKIVVSSLYLSVPLYTLGFVYEFNFKGLVRKANYWFLCLNLFLAIVLFKTKNNSVLVRETYLKLNFCMFLGILWIFVIFGKKVLSSFKEKSPGIYLNFFLILLFLPFAFRDVYVLANKLPTPLVHQYILPLFLMANLLYIFHDFVSVYRKFLLERRKSILLEQESMRDPLTGALNRRFITRIAEIVPDYYTLALIDIDDFKSLNDSYGHLIGDCVLKGIVQGISKHIRKEDHIVRYGGDEFILMLYKCTLEDAEAIIEKIQAYFAMLPLKCDEIPIYVSFSYGLANKSHGYTLNDIIKSADKKLYETKKIKKTKQ
ncbi:MAG: GGDEF domain-containing protein [candidate division WOR-3 bacterium]